ncbi:MAG: methyltransferase domain-containing protein, partial [Patescibacteria group bacterium]|nr:methyltransferase domain-containing protein [Patescibacteria group bacterium]
QNITRQEIDHFLKFMNIASDDKILDLCCGQGRHALELARRGFQNIEGLDRSHYLIQKAKLLAKKEGLNVRVREGDARKLPYTSDNFDLVTILGNSFGYFDTINEDMSVLKEIFRVMKPWGQILIDVTDGEYLRKNFQPRSWEWMDKNHFVCRERSLSLDEQRLISREIINHAEKGVVADQFYAERLYSSDGIGQLLRSAGFSNIVFHGEISPDSQRNQDLGMMEKRIIVTAVARKEWTPVKRKTNGTLTHVAVLLGDPGKPDVTKPNCSFDNDDFYTIDEMKNALRELKQYQFSFLSNHNTFIQDMQRLQGKVNYVLNLCDEGYYNEARKELHVPALLEIMGIPYTGAGPQSLAFCYDKSLVRGVAKEMDIPVPFAFFVKAEDTTFELTCDFPVIVKPNLGDSSFGITQRSVAYSLEELVNAISEVRTTFGYERPMLVEEFLSGKDISIGIVGNPPQDYTVLPIIEEDYSLLPDELPRICGYEAKWLPDSPYFSITSIPVELPKETEEFVIDCCLKLFERLECRDYCRFDWRLDSKGNPKLLEVNPNPGWCWDGHLNKMAKLSGLTYSGLLESILKAAEQRFKTQLVEKGNGNGSGQSNGNGSDDESLVSKVVTENVMVE